MPLYKFSDVCDRKPVRLPTLRPDGKTYYSTANIDKTFSILIANRLATLRELEEYYSIDDALDILECWSVNQFNRYIAQQPTNRRGFKWPPSQT